MGWCVMGFGMSGLTTGSVLPTGRFWCDAKERLQKYHGLLALWFP